MVSAIVVVLKRADLGIRFVYTHVIGFIMSWYNHAVKKFRLLEGLFLGVTWVCLRFVIVVIPDHTHYLWPILGVQNLE